MTLHRIVGREEDVVDEDIEECEDEVRLVELLVKF